MSANGIRVTRTYAKRQQMIREWKADQGCRDCGEVDPVVLDCHHVDPESKNPRLRHGGTAQRGMFKMSFADIEAELEKCIVLCANCHRREEARLREED